MTDLALESGTEGEFLLRVKHSLASAYDKVRERARLDGEGPSIFDMKVFTDNIVVAHPLRNPARDLGEPELGTLLMLFAEVQAGLAADGFFLRGAIAAGSHYQDDDIAYGDALLEAVDLDKSGGPPRLVIASSVEPLISRHLSWYYGVKAPHHNVLHEDPRRNAAREASRKGATMPDEVGTEATRSDAPSADDSLFGDAAEDTAQAVTEEQDANEEPQGADGGEEQPAPPEDLKVVVSLKGGRATIGVQQRPRPTRTSSPSTTLSCPGWPRRSRR